MVLLRFCRTTRCEAYNQSIIASHGEMTPRPKNGRGVDVVVGFGGKVMGRRRLVPTLFVVWTDRLGLKPSVEPHPAMAVPLHSRLTFTHKSDRRRKGDWRTVEMVAARASMPWLTTKTPHEWGWTGQVAPFMGRNSLAGALMPRRSLLPMLQDSRFSPHQKNVGKTKKVGGAADVPCPIRMPIHATLY